MHVSENKRVRRRARAQRSFTKRTLAAFTGWSPRRIEALTASGELPAERFLGGRTPYYKDSAVAGVQRQMESVNTSTAGVRTPRQLATPAQREEK